jgi:hypothetical protein
MYFQESTSELSMTSVTDVKTAFEDETAGFENHPGALLLYDESEHNTDSVASHGACSAPILSGSNMCNAASDTVFQNTIYEMLDSIVGHNAG